VSFPGPGQSRFYPVDGVSFSLGRGETLALVGESGSGKSLSSLALLQLVPPPGRIESGSQIHLGDTDVLALKGEALRRIRGRRIGMIFQDPMTSLNPVFTVGDQIMEGILAHFRLPRARARERALQLLQEVGIPDPVARLRAYPHQLSGGMRQRAVIGIALACRPSILIADEPTTALDVTTQAVILDLLRALQEEFGMAIQMITHNLGVVAEMADEVVVMYLGRQVEQAPVAELFENPLHPYTKALLRSMPKLGRTDRHRLEAIKGMVPDPFSIPKGCPFHTRCPHYKPGICDDPQYVEFSPGHWVRCSRAGEIS
jgi:peptide/nickel transport system ATP-binding protein